MNEIVRFFQNDTFDLAVKLEDNEWVFDAEKVAECLGFTQVQNKNGKKYTSIRWETINKHLEKFFPNKVGKGDFIPEPAVYKLAFKASNDIAEKFQDWLAIDVLPKLRQTGEYKIKEQLPLDDKLGKLQLEKEGLKLAVDLLKPSKSSTVKMLKDFNTSQGLSTSYLPDYVDDEVGFSATALLQKFNVDMNIRQFNNLMVEHGFLERKTRPSTGKRKFKSYIS